MHYALHNVDTSVCAHGIIKSFNKNIGNPFHCYFKAAQATFSHPISQNNKKMQLQLSLGGGTVGRGWGGWGVGGMVLLSRLISRQFSFLCPTETWE